MLTSSSLQLGGDGNSSYLLSKYICTTCLVSFETSVPHRAHMRGDWHVYNLKRRISSLPAISLDVFEEQVAPSLVTSQEREDSSIQETCDARHKLFYSKQAYHGHLRSQNHSASSNNALVAEINAVTLDEPEDLSTGKAQKTTGDEFIPSACLFCTKTSLDIEDNLIHMQRIHGLFIPAQEHLIDIESFLNFLFTIISEFQECLYCSITKSTVEGIQHHMRDKGHCKINLEEGSEWHLFYEYSDSESDAKTLKSRIITTLDDELHLPSGKILGHRSHVRNHQSSTAAQASSSALTAPSPFEIGAALPTTASTRSNEARTNQQLTVRNSDRLGTLGVPVQQQRALRAVEKMMLKRESRAREAYQARIQKAGNQQNFFKPDVPGRSNG